MKRLIFFLIVFISSCNFNRSKDDWKCIEGNCIDGAGTKQWPDGGIEKGNWKNGKLFGQGNQFFGTTSTFAGDSYSGEFNEKGYVGNGTYFDKSEDSKFTGEWKNSKPNGKGKIIWGENSNFSGMYYEGEFKDGKFDGFGTKFWGIQGKFKNNKYVGQWKEGEMNGIGKYYWASGSSHEGEWKNGVRHGKGKYIGKDGEIFLGTWVDGNCEEFEKRFGNK